MFPKPAAETNQGEVQVSYVSINVLRDQRSVDCVLSEVKLCIDVVQKTATALFLVYRGSDQFGSDIKLLGPQCNPKLYYLVLISLTFLTDKNISC